MEVLLQKQCIPRMAMRSMNKNMQFKTNFENIKYFINEEKFNEMKRLY